MSIIARKAQIGAMHREDTPPTKTLFFCYAIVMIWQVYNYIQWKKTKQNKQSDSVLWVVVHQDGFRQGVSEPSAQEPDSSWIFFPPKQKMSFDHGKLDPFPPGRTENLGGL